MAHGATFSKVVNFADVPTAENDIFHSAVLRGNLEFVKFLHPLYNQGEYGGIAADLDSQQYSALHVSVIWFSTIEMVEFLASAHPELHHCRDGSGGFTPLHHAMMNGRMDAVGALVRLCPASLAYTDLTESATPLHIAFRGHTLDMVRLVLPFAREACPRAELRSAAPYGDGDGRADFRLWPVTLRGYSIFHDLCQRGDTAIFIEAVLTLLGEPGPAYDILSSRPNHYRVAPLEMACDELKDQAGMLISERRAALEMVQALGTYLLPDVANVVVEFASLNRHSGLAREATDFYI